MAVMFCGEDTIGAETESRIAVCIECAIRNRDFSENELYKCELCGRWFCGKHLRPRTFLVRGADVQDEQMPEGTALDDVPVEPSPEQGTLILGTAPSWIKERAREINDIFRSRGEKQEQWKHQDSHPDFQYTRKVLEKLGIEEEKRSELMKRALNRVNRYYSPERLRVVDPNCAELRNKTESREKPNAEKHFPTKDVAFLLVLLALAIVVWYALR